MNEQRGAGRKAPTPPPREPRQQQSEGVVVEIKWVDRGHGHGHYTMTILKFPGQPQPGIYQARLTRIEEGQ